MILAATVFIFVYLGMIWGFVSLAAAALFFGLMLFFKGRQEQEERKQNPPPPVGDFITGKIPEDNDKDKS